VKSIQGRARFRDGKTVVVETETGEQVIRAEQIVIATGSCRSNCRSCRFGGAVISSTEALSLKRGSRTAGRRRRRLYRAGAWHGVRQARRKGDRGRGADRASCRSMTPS
jgi:hypothetical protein